MSKSLIGRDLVLWLQRQVGTLVLKKFCKVPQFWIFGDAMLLELKVWSVYDDKIITVYLVVTCQT